MKSRVKLKDLGRKPKILFVNEASFLRTGFSTIGWHLMKRLQETGKYEIVELASYATQSDPRWKDARWGINWKYYGAMPEKTPQENSGPEMDYKKNYHHAQFGRLKFDEVLLKEKPDIVFDPRDYWMSFEWQLKSPYRKYFTYAPMPCIDSHPPMPQWVKDYKDAEYIFGYSWYAKRVLEQEGVECHRIINPGVDLEVFNNETPRSEVLKRWGLRTDLKPILCVHRNQKRKLLPDVIYSYLALKNENPEAFKNSVLWFHTSWPDVGFNIPVVMDRAKQGRYPFKDAKGKIKEKRFKKGLKYADVMFSYICHNCDHAFVSPYVNGIVEVKDLETGQVKQDKLTCDLIYCQKCGKKSARMPNTQLGFNPEDFADVYRAAYVFVQASIAGAAEMPIAEAKACGIPVLASAHAAMHEQVEKVDYCKDDRWKGGMPIQLDALYTEAETMQHRCIISKEDLTKKLCKILTNKSLRQKLSKEASEIVKDYYDWNKIADVFEGFLWNEAEVRVGDDSWEAPAQMKEYGDYSIPTKEQADDASFMKWCYSHFLSVEQPDEGGFRYWLQDLGKGRNRENVVQFFRQQADEHNRRELIRTGKATKTQSTSKVSDFLDPEDKFRIIVILPRTAGDVHLISGTLKSLHKKYNRKDKWGIYVSCEDAYKDLLTGLPYIKGFIPYSPHIDNAKALEQAGICNMAFTPHVITQRFEHYAHRGYGKHLAHAYADMCGVELSPPEVIPIKIQGLPKRDFYVIHCKTSMKSKDWPIDRFQSLVKLFPDEQFIQVGSASDPAIEAPNVINLLGKTTFRKLAYVIKKAEGVIGPDSIPLHLASAVGTKSVGLFSATYPQVCGPLNNHGGLFVMPQDRPEQCKEPCMVVQCPSPVPCINHINVRQVAGAMEKVFGE